MRESQIRPDKLMQENARLRRGDLRLLLKQKHKFVTVNCVACGSKKNRQRWHKNGFRFVTCVKCETVFVNPRPTATMLSRFYQQALSIKHWSDKIFSVSEQTRREQIFKPRAERITELCHKYEVKRRLLVDVGAGFGTFGEEMKKLKIFERLIMVEPSPDLAQTCRNKGLEVIETTIEETRLTSVDVMTNFELIEHLFSPQEFIRACARTLSKNGLLILTTPNIKGFDLLVLGKASDHIAGPNHLNYFHPLSITDFVERCGLRVLEITTPGQLDADVVRNKIIKGKYKLGRQEFLKELLINRWKELGQPWQEFLRQHNLSSHMWLVAQKR